MRKSVPLAAIGVTLGLLTGGSALLTAAPSPWFQYDSQYGDIRGLVERAQMDLQTASRMQHNDGDQRSRYKNAERHLSTFDRHLTKGHFDKGELDTAISDLQHIIDKNTLEPSTRDALMRDIEDLRGMRSHR